ncbi:MAG: hypothetical protein PHE59_04620, partial [Patescibacteria group bacterium]|nr:hypothetical protein [Patescibacteria group bacterium]
RVKDFEPKYVYPAVAREIMKRNIFGIEEVIKHFHLHPTDEDLAILSQVPYSEKVLRVFKDSHILVVNYGESIIDQRDLSPQFFYGSKNAWYNSEEFAKNPGKIGWNLIRKTEIPGSINKSWSDQMSLLRENEKVPTAQEFVNAIVAFSILGERLFKHRLLRVYDIDRYGNCVYIGNPRPTNIRIYKYEKSVRLEGVGLASQIIPT